MFKRKSQRKTTSKRPSKDYLKHERFVARKSRKNLYVAISAVILIVAFILI